ncbi:MAG: phosphotransferase [Planctomycetota bacterium]
MPAANGPQDARVDEDPGASVSGILVVPETGPETVPETAQKAAASARPGADHEPASASDHDTFDPGELVAVCSRYDLGTIYQARVYRRGSRRSPKMVLDTEAGLLLLKRRAPRLGGAARVRFCHMVQKRLEQRGYPVAKLMLTRDGATCVYLHESAAGSGQPAFAYEMFGFVNGKRFDRSPEAAAAAGRALAGFHRNAADLHTAPSPDEAFKPPTTCFHGIGVVPQQLDMLATRLGRASEKTMRLCCGLRDAYSLARDEVDGLGFETWPTQIIHGDWHPGNLVFRDRDIAAVLDLDSARLVPRVVDAASGAAQFSMTRSGLDPGAWPEGLDEPRLEAFLRAYDTSDGCVLSSVECRALPWLMIEAIIAEVVIPIAATGRFGAIEPIDMLRMVERKVEWIRQRVERITGVLT